jgi:2-polyprenyl-3-methyl-5-hydroxy-6-metoxy-1,4-benzoquinol methylase
MSVLRAHRLVRIDRVAWRVLAATSPRLFARALRGAFAVAPLVDAVAIPPDVDGHEARFFTDEEVLAASASAIDDGLWDVERRIADRFLPAGSRVLDVGCGTGREAIAFARRGMIVHAIDPSRGAIERARELARERGLDVSFEAAALEDFGAIALRGEFAPFDAVFFASDVIAATRSRAALLLRARDLVRDGGVVAYQREVGRGRLTRAIFSAWGRDPGDSFAWHGPPPVAALHNVAADERAVVLEARAAGLTWKARVGTYVVTCRDDARRDVGDAETRREDTGRERLQATTRPSFPPAPDPLALELARVAFKFRLVERARRELGPKDAASVARRLGEDAPRRDALGRAQLRRAIAVFDRAVPRGAGCYRRVLLEAALDAGAATETIHLGLHRNERSGHAWLDPVAPADAYDITTTL